MIDGGFKAIPVIQFLICLDGRIVRISALVSDFDYFISDDVVGFDPHPGPYWHYAISRKLIDVVAQTQPAASH